ncbi:MAG: hypothetical protein HOO98_05080 [Nitrospira sp.]|nr:hypothetical protein [Nitrospira sp.]
MPRRPAYIPTPDLNAIMRRAYTRMHGGPRNPDLCALVVQRFTEGLRRSSQRQDKQRLRILERLGEAEKLLVDSGGNIEDELAKPGKGVFGPLLRSLAGPPGQSRVPIHDPSILRFQYSELGVYLKKHPFPVAPVRRNADLRKQEAANAIRVWLKTCWKTLGSSLIQYPCLCHYRHTPPTYGTLYSNDSYSNPSNLFHRLLAHLHRSKADAIAQDLKPSRRRSLERRM